MKKIPYLVMTAAVLCLFALPVSGTEQKQEKKEISASDVRRQADEAAKTTGGYLLQKKEQYQKKAEDRLDRIENKVKRFYARAEDNGIRAKEKIAESADMFRKKSDKAKDKLADLKSAGVEKWENMKIELDTMIKDLEQSYKRTVSKFKD